MKRLHHQSSVFFVGLAKILLMTTAITGFITYPLDVKAKDFILINKIMYDTPLNEQIAAGQAYSNGEFVELYNTGTETINLTGWTLYGGGSSEIYNFPVNTTMPPRSFLIVAYQSINTNFTLDQLFPGLISTPSKQILTQRKIILSNTGEPVYLRNNYGVTKDSIYYDGTSNKTKPNRLSAENADGISGDSCVCIQRKTATFKNNGSAVLNNAEWTTDIANASKLHSSFIPPILPGVGESYSCDSSSINAVITSSGNSFSSSNIPAIGVLNNKFQQINGNDFTKKNNYTFPVIWFKTIPISMGIQDGYYAWCDFSGNNAKLRKSNLNGATHGEEYIVYNTEIKTYNFNPALNISLEQVSKEIFNSKSNLEQTTIIGVWGPSEENIPENNNFMFAINGRPTESAVLTKSNVVSCFGNVNLDLSYGNSKAKNFLFQPENLNENSIEKFNEQSLRIATYYKANRPNNMLWGEKKNSIITLGGDFDNSSVNNVSDFENKLNINLKYNGYTPELLVFDKLLTPKESGIFQTYLALKYGISLDSTYIAPNGDIMWDYCNNENTPYNYRITGYTRQDALGLYQTTSTTAYEEAPYLSYIKENDSYDNKDHDNMSSRKKLLVVGNEPANPFNNGDYVLFGDNNQSIGVTNAENNTGNYRTMERKWLLKTNVVSVEKNTQSLPWIFSPKVQISDNSNHTLTLYKPSTILFAGVITEKKLKGKDGYIGWTITNLSGSTTVKFGTKSNTLRKNSNDYGYVIRNGGKTSKIERGYISETFFETINIGQKLEIEKTGNVIYIRINGRKIKNSECLITEKEDLTSDYYGSITIENSNKVVISDLRHGGFINTGNRVELSFYTDRASDFSTNKENVYLIVDRSGIGTFASNTEDYQVSEIDSIRSKLIFNNVFWDTDGNGKDVFTFGYKSETNAQAVKKQNQISNEDLENRSYALAYYKDLKDLSNVTVKVLLYKSEPYTVLVTDISGRLVYQNNYQGSKTEQFIDIKLPHPGFYVIKVESTSFQYCTKIVSNK